MIAAVKGSGDEARDRCLLASCIINRSRMNCSI